MSHTLDVTQLEYIFNGLVNHFDRLSKWEQDFVDSVKDQWESRGTLTDNQLAKLEEIWIKVP